MGVVDFHRTTPETTSLEQKGYGHVEISCVGLLQDKVVR